MLDDLRRRRILLAVTLTALVAVVVPVVIGQAASKQGGANASTATTSPTAAATPSPVWVDPPRPVWVEAAVATVWVKPSAVRRVDAAAIAARPAMSRWIRAQTLAQRLDLADRVMTQAWHGERMVRLGGAAGWSQVLLPDQRGSAYPLGIIGWVPSRQLSTRPVRATLPLLTPVRHPTGAVAVAAARRFTGAPYLWAGMTSRGIDCSGLTYLVFRHMGVTLPRDAADQSRLGRPVNRRSLQPGDLVFFGPGGRSTVHHVGIYAGRGLVLHAPHTGSTVRLTPLRRWTDYWGARRLLPAR